MNQLLFAASRWVFHKFLILLVILAILIGGKWLYAKWVEFTDSSVLLEQFQSERGSVKNALGKADKALLEKLSIQTASNNNIGKLQILAKDLATEKRRELEQLKRTSPINVHIPATREFTRSIVLEMELSVLDEVQANAETFRLLIQNVQAGEEQIGKLEQDKSRADWRLYENKLEQWKIRRDNPFLSQVWRTAPYLRLTALASLQPALEKSVSDTQARIDGLNVTIALAKKKAATALEELARTSSGSKAALAKFDERIRQLEEASIRPMVMNELPTAVGVLLSIILVPIGIKLLFYYVIAPWASRQDPIRILPRPPAQLHPAPGPDDSGGVHTDLYGVSASIRMADDEELVLHSDHVQSSASQSKKNTKWVLQWAYPFTSLAAGMYGLTRILPFNSEPVVVSSSKDPSEEIAVIEVPAGAAIVFQPHSLVGVVQRRDAPLRITSHWRLGHLQSWLTLQLRYLVFHGPARLIARGCRGVRLERVRTGRLINQAATLGFSADAEYSVVRCETFLSYWRGEQELFNDHFAGESGVYIYEEVPSKSRRVGSTRWLEGVFDSLLKVVGV